jgi:hypothetical protein
MSTYRLVHNISALISTIEVLDGTEAVFPCWHSRLDDVLGLQNTIDIVKGTLPRPKDDSKTDSTAVNRSPTDSSKGYYPKEIAADWDALSEMACSTIRLTLSNPLAQQYRKVKPAS